MLTEQLVYEQYKKLYINNALKRIVSLEGLEKIDNFGMELVRVNNK